METEVEYNAKSYFCDQAEECFSDEEMISANDIAMKNAFRKASGLLSPGEITAVRQRYGISQSNLCLLPGWCAGTAARYEGHQLQVIARDTPPRGIDKDPEWFISLLEAKEDRLFSASYEKYRTAALRSQESYLDLQ